MPYMHIEDPAALEHLLQLFLAAHPDHQAAHQRQRDETGKPQAYFLSPALVAELLPWALDRHLLTPQAADNLHRTVQLPGFSANNPPAHAREKARKSLPGAGLRADAGVRSAH